MIPLKDNPHWGTETRQLSPRSKEVFAEIVDRLAIKGLPGTLPELARGLGITPQAAQKHLTRLRRNGWVKMIPGPLPLIMPTIGIEPFLIRLRLAVRELRQGTPLDVAAQQHDVPETILAAIRSYLPLACDPD